MNEGFSHINESGDAQMVDVGQKDVTDRIAVASCRVTMLQQTLQKIRDGGFEKGDVLGVAKVAGVMAAKSTANLIPLCHPIPLTHIDISIEESNEDFGLDIEASVRALWKTGVEMEALTAVTIASLTVYDMCKSLDKSMKIESVRLIKKSGGKQGDFLSR